jgi:hypothetical protein
MPTPTRKPTLTPTLAPTVTGIPTPAPTSKLIEGWLTYRNATDRYELSYPPQATLATEGVTSYPTEELPPNMAPDEFFAKLQQIYPGDLCVSIRYRMGFITIQAPQDKGGKYTGPCGVTGVGDYDVITKTETILIDGKSYPANGYEEYERNKDATFRAEFFMIQLENGTWINYGGYWTDNGETYKDYQPVEKILLQILASYSSY